MLAHCVQREETPQLASGDSAVHIPPKPVPVLPQRFEIVLAEGHAELSPAIAKQRAAYLACLFGRYPNASFHFYIGGFDHDPRPLYQIAEVVMFLRCWTNALQSHTRDGDLQRFSPASRAYVLWARDMLPEDELIALLVRAEHAEATAAQAA